MSASDIFRFASIAVRRYSRRPEERLSAARLLLTSAVRLYAAETCAGDAALLASEVIAELARDQRLAQREIDLAAIEASR